MDYRQERGTILEQTANKLFESLGYKTELHKTMQGKSGVEYQIDVYVERKREKSLVECKYKSFREEVGKDILALALLEVDDLSLSKGYIVTNSTFTSSSISLSRRYSILELIDGNNLTRLLRENNLQSSVFSSDDFIYRTISSGIESLAKILI